MDTFTKQPSEAFWISVSFAANLEEDEAIDYTTCTVVVINNKGVDVTNSIITPSTVTSDRAAKIMCHVHGGVYEDSPYKITLKGTTDSTPGNTWEKDLLMRCKEI